MTISDFTFLGFRVAEFRCLVGDSLSASPEQINQSVHIERAFDASQKNLVQITVNITLKAESGNLDLFLKIRGLFKAPDEMPDETFKKLAALNAPAILYPFARGIIASFTAQANIPSIILPVANFATENAPKEPTSTKSDG